MSTKDPGGSPFGSDLRRVGFGGVPDEVSVLREEIIRHGVRAGRFSYPMLLLGAIFVLLTDAGRQPVAPGGIPITNISLVLTAIPPAVGFLLIQAVDSAYMRQKYMTILEDLVQREAAHESRSSLPAFVFVPYNWPPAEMMREHPRAAECLHALELVTNFVCLAIGGIFLLFAAYTLHHRFGVSNVPADAAVLLTAAAVARAVSAMVAIGMGDSKPAA